MKKLYILTLGLALLAFTGCTVTRQEKNSMKEPNGNIRVETATIKRFVPVSYTYETNVTSCSEVAFLTYVTKQDPTINNIYEIHWNQIENHKNYFGAFTGEKKYTCEFWGVGIQYGDPLPKYFKKNPEGDSVAVYLDQNNSAAEAPVSNAVNTPVEQQTAKTEEVNQ